MGLASLGVGGFVIGIIIGVALLVLFMYLAQYIYKDAVKRNLSAELWLLIIFIVPVISWIVYFIVRNVKTTATKKA